MQKEIVWKRNFLFGDLYWWLVLPAALRHTMWQVKALQIVTRDINEIMINATGTTTHIAEAIGVIMTVIATAGTETGDTGAGS